MVRVFITDLMKQNEQPGIYSMQLNNLVIVFLLTLDITLRHKNLS